MSLGGDAGEEREGCDGSPGETSAPLIILQI